MRSFPCLLACEKPDNIITRFEIYSIMNTSNISKLEKWNLATISVTNKGIMKFA